MAIEKTNIRDVMDKNYAEFDLGLLCEEAYKSLKHIDMVIYTILKNQHGLSIKTTLSGSKRFMDSNGYIFISIGQEKLCKLLRTTKPTLIASLKRLEEVELIQVATVGNMKCNRIYVGKLKRTITLGDYMENMSIGEEEVTEFKPSINVTNKKDLPAPTDKPIQKSKTSNNNVDNSISYKNNTSNTNSYPKRKYNNLENESFRKYTPTELENILEENQRSKFIDIEKTVSKIENGEIDVPFKPNF